jgi:N-terminal acetyltransferase B complex non-catalytic subunit
MIVQAFKFGTFSKIPEFIDFKNQLANSVQRAVTQRQLNRLELLGSNNWSQFCDKVNKIDISTLSLDGSCPFLSIM